jgi:hypothetical protein
MKKRKKNRGLRILSISILICIILVFSFLLYFQYSMKSTTGKAISDNNYNTVFYFYLNGSRNFIDGDIILDDVYYGRTVNGQISMTNIKIIPKILRFKGIFNQSVFDLIYHFPENYNYYQYVPFIVFERDLIKDDYYYLKKLHWGHMPITYSFYNYCSNTDRLIKSFEEFNRSTNGSVYFISTNSTSPDIRIICFSNQSSESDYYTEILGESGLNNIKNNLIVDSTIAFYPTISSCGYFPIVELHEILHSFGYNHINKISSIMYNTTDNCKWLYENQDINGPLRIDDNISQELIEMYNRNNTI